jgi:catechol 2,3-dioxygenase-like lactoylglutathione lyase family enzyme
MANVIKSGGVHHFALTVSDVQRSFDFYTSLLGFQFVMDFGPRKLLSNGSVVLAVGPAPSPAQAIANDSFNENRIGLDHVSLSVGSIAELEDALRLLDAKGVPHGEIANLAPAGISILAFRDPDNIQIELTAPNS